MKKKINIQFQRLHDIQTWSYPLVDMVLREFLNNVIPFVLDKHNCDIVLDESENDSDSFLSMALKRSVEKYKSKIEIHYDNDISKSDLVIAIGMFSEEKMKELSSAKKLIFFKTQKDEQ